MALIRLTLDERRVFEWILSSGNIPFGAGFLPDVLGTNEGLTDPTFVAIKSLINKRLIERVSPENSTEFQGYWITQYARELFVSTLKSGVNIDDPISSPSLPSLTGGEILGDPVFGSSGLSASTETNAGLAFGPNLGGPNLGLEPIVSASDRYVSVRDNQRPFDELDRPLEQILEEYKRDHKKSNFPRGADVESFISEIEATRAQIRSRRVRVGQLSEQLSPQLQNALLIFASYPGISQFIQDAINALQELLSVLR